MSPPATPFIGGVTSTATFELLGIFLSAVEQKDTLRHKLWGNFDLIGKKLINRIYIS